MTDRLEHLDPELFDHVPVDVYNALADIVNTLCDGADLYEAHVENLIERMARVDQHLWPAEWTEKRPWGPDHPDYDEMGQ